MSEDIETSYWQIDLIAHEKAEHNGLTYIRFVVAVKDTPKHTLIVRNPLTIRLSLEERKELKQLDVPDQKLERLNIR